VQSVNVVTSSTVQTIFAVLITGYRTRSTIHN